MQLAIPSVNSLRQTVREIGKDILKIYNNTDKHIEIKSDNSPVTEADILSHQLLRKLLQPTGIPIISEEDKEFQECERYAWIVDPLDGTSDFIKHTGEFSLMIGLVENGQPVFGLIYQPTSDKCYVAQKGKGAFLYEGKLSVKSLQVNHTKDIEQLTIIVSRNHLMEKDKIIIRELGIKNIIECGSIGVKIGLLCEGKADLFINSSNKTWIWDSCAAQILIEEAGGKMTDLYKNDLLYSKENLRNEYGIIGTNRLIYEDIAGKLESILNEGH